MGNSVCFLLACILTQFLVLYPTSFTVLRMKVLAKTLTWASPLFIFTMRKINKMIKLFPSPCSSVLLQSYDKVMIKNVYCTNKWWDTILTVKQIKILKTEVPSMPKVTLKNQLWWWLGLQVIHLNNSHFQ